MKSQDLKKSILQYAMQGKLVPQDSNDEPASELLKRIKAEKERLIKEGKIKKEKPLQQIPIEERPFAIPTNWKWVRLGEIFQHNTGKALNSSKTDGIKFSYITTSNLYWNDFKLDNIREMYFSKTEVEKYTVKRGDLLVLEGGDIGRAAIWNKDYSICIQNHIHRLRPYVCICIKFFYYLLLLYKLIGFIDGKGIGIKGLSSNALHIIPFPLPPLAEQKRIVEKLEEILPLVEEYGKNEEILSEMNQKLPKQIRQSILQYAVQGKLIEQNPQDEPASELLKRIKAEKEQLIKDGKIKKEKPLPPITQDEIPYDLPQGWQWVRLGEILTKLTDGAHKTPNYQSSGVPFLSVKDISSGYIDFSNTKFISESEHKELFKRCNPQKGDMLLTKVGTTGVPAIVETDKEFSLFVSVALLKFNNKFIDIKYLYNLILSPLVQAQAKENTKGIGNKNWVIDKIAQTIIPIPPLAEQKRIVAKVEELLKLVNKLEV